MFESQ
jgi:hypothetical protein